MTEKFSLSGKTPEGRLFWASVLLLFGEVIAIRWLGIEVPTIQVFPNLVLLSVLVAASAGMGSPHKYKIPPLCLLAATSVLFLTLIFAVPLGIPEQSIKLGATSNVGLILSVVTLLAMVTSIFVVFVKVGAVMAEGFSNLPPLRAYSINLAGSIAGVVLAALISVFYMPPPLWILACGLVCWQLSRSKLVPIAAVIFALCACATTLSSYWSPYSKLDVIPMKISPGAGQSFNYLLNSNNHFFHAGVHVVTKEEADKILASPKSPEKASVEEYIQHYYDILNTPFAYAPRHDRVLILGGGSGTDVGFALLNGAKHIDVVEIDPIISSFGKTKHPDRPYLDPRVTLHTEDARTFLRYTKEKYDLIEFAYLDPGCTLNTASFIRVDNFVYTMECIRSAISHLDRDGLLTVSFATGSQSPVTHRLYQTIAQAQGSPPLAYIDDKFSSVLFLAGPTASTLKIDSAKFKNLVAWQPKGEAAATRAATDDWPFLYLINDPIGAAMYFGILIVAIIVPALILTRSGTGDVSGGAWGNMFFLGQAFMLVETKSITQLSLFFGATWLVSSVVIFCVLILAYLANWVAGRLKTNNVLPAYIGLFAGLLLDVCFRVPTDTQVHPLLLAVVATLIACLPIFFGGLIFSLCFRQAKSPSLYLSANLLGVAVGGLTENLCLVTGIKGLPLIAMVLYGLSFLALRASARYSQPMVAADKAT